MSDKILDLINAKKKQNQGGFGVAKGSGIKAGLSGGKPQTARRSGNRGG